MAEGDRSAKAGDKDEEGRSIASWTNAASGLFDAVASLLKVATIVFVVGLVAWNWRSVEAALEEVTTLEFDGLKVTRDVAFAAIEELRRRNPEVDTEWVRGAAIRAIRNSRAISGKKLLGVDDRLENNEQERAVLQALRVTIHLARSTDQALERIRRAPDDYDAVISDVNRAPPDPQATELRNCQVHHFAFPTAELPLILTAT